MSLVRAHLRIYGWVQGVFFRSSMRRVAKRLGVVGWVRNLPDGSVEAVVEGEKEKVEEIIKWAHRGPELAVVERVDVEWEEPTGEFDDFSIIY
ncbi:MAG: acylphosphatase [Candidatus Methanodesulfokora sp.]|jgi:acylphosphatase|nr:MAG: acylphosphatase [Candidatus Korarchaeota archaeon]